MNKKQKLVRITTVPLSLDKLLGGQMSFMKDYYEVIAVSSDAPYLTRIGEREQVDVFCVEMTRQITPIQDLKSLWKLYRFFRRERPSIVHTHTPKAGTVGMMAAYMAGVPNRLHTVAGLPLLEAKGRKRKLLNLVEKITYKCATHVYPNSEGLKDIIAKAKFCPVSKLKVIANGSSNGIDTAYFNSGHFSNKMNQDLRNLLNIEANDFVFIFVGRLVSDKGINELVEAFDAISQEYENVKLLLVGPLEAELDPLTDKTDKIIKTNKKIISLGFQTDVRPYFSIANALVFPSYREGFPNVVLQAGAMGLPSIVSDINGCNEIILENINGTIIPTKDMLALKTKMILFLRNCDLVNQLSKTSRQLILNRYEQRVVWEALLKEYSLL